MSRHRDIRNMDYSDDYDGYDDVYGHSVDEDDYISPSNRQFIYNRENSERSSDVDIKEEDEVEIQLSDVERSNLESCIDAIKSTLGTITVTRNELINLIISNKFDVEQSIHLLLDNQKFQSKEIDDTKQPNPLFRIPKLDRLSQKADIKKKFNVPNIFNKKIQTNNLNKSEKFSVPKLNVNKLPNKSGEDTKNSEFFSSLSDLVSSHLGSPPSYEINRKIKNMHLENSSNINELLQDTQNLKISQIKSQNDCKIDLSIALKSTNSVPSLTKCCQNEKFEIPFVDCDKLAFSKNIPILLPCKFDKKDILRIKIHNTKEPSKLGNVICRRYTRPRYILADLFYNNCDTIKHFHFGTPSPDDIIRSYLK